MANPINIKFPLKKSTKGAFATNNTTLEAIKDNLKILILTNHGERVCLPDFGANLRSILFEQSNGDLAEQAKQLIIVAIDKWMPFVKVDNLVALTSVQDRNIVENALKIKLYFSVGPIKDVLDFSFAL